MNRDQYAALTAEDLEWLDRMEWGGPKFDDDGQWRGLMSWQFLPSISADHYMPTSAEIQAGVN